MKARKLLVFCITNVLGSLLIRLRCQTFGFCLPSFLQNERKIYKLRQLSLSQFVSIYIYFYKILSFVKVNIDGSALKKYTNWDKLSCLSLYIFLLFRGNQRRQKPNIPYLNELGRVSNHPNWCQFSHTKKFEIFEKIQLTKYDPKNNKDWKVSPLMSIRDKYLD